MTEVRESDHAAQTATADSAARRFLAHGLHVMSKPIGPICNLDCEYCYYLHKEDLYGRGERWRMPESTLETYIRQYIDAQPAGTPEITFAWQGGEPTLLGLEFFRRVVEIQQQHTPPKSRIVNTLQTNGVLLNQEWCEFFKANGFLIGLSIDGPAELHDHYRYDKQGNPTFAAVLRALNLLKKLQVEFNVLVTVHRHNGDHGKRVYTYLRDNGVKFLQFIPIVERRGVGAHAEPLLEASETESSPPAPGDSFRHPERLVSSRSVLPEQFGDFLIGVFDEWKRRDVGQVFVQIFDQALSAWMGIEPSLCVFRKQCGRALALEHNGDLYSCDHFVEPEYKLGNIHELPIIEMAGSQQQRDFGAAKETTLPEYCRQCEVLSACNGECPKNRFLETPDGEPGLNYLCAGYRKFFNHVAPVMEAMVREVRAGRPAAAAIRKPPTAQRRGPEAITPGGGGSAGGTVGRNDPCPCGSGRKYKKCCLAGRG